MLFNSLKNRRCFYPVLLTYFLDNFGLAIIYPIFTPLLVESEHSILSYTTPHFTRTLLLGLLIAAFPLAQFFGAPLIGQFSDRFGRKRAFYITILGTAFGYTFTALSIITHSLIGLFISRFATGLFAGNLTLCLAAIADMSPDDTTRTKNFSLISAVGGLSFIIAIAFGGILSNPGISKHFNPSFPFWITALLSYINLVCMLLLFHETHKGPRHPGINPLKGFNNLLQGVKSKELRTLYAVNFLFMIAWVGSMQFLPNLLLEQYKFHIGQITACLMGVGAGWSLSNMIVNRKLAKLYFPGQTLLACLLLLSLLLLFTLMTRGPASFLFLFFASACCASLCWTNGIATISLKAPLAIQGSILGINQSMTSIAAMISPIIGGLLAAISPHAVFAFGGIAALLAFYTLFSQKAYTHHSHVD